MTAGAKPKHARVRVVGDRGAFRTVCGVRYVDGSAVGSDGGATSHLSEVTCARCKAGWAAAQRALREDPL